MLRVVFDSIDNIIITILLKPDTSVRFVRKADCATIAEVCSHTALYTAAVRNDQTVDVDNHIAWSETRTLAGYPVLVSEGSGVVTGYTPFSDWCGFDGFRHTVEYSVYIHPDHQGKGLGRKSLSRLIDEARDCGKHVMVAGIESQSQASLHLHQSLGFVITAQMPQVGTKSGRWPDLTSMRLQLDERTEPDVIR